MGLNRCFELYASDIDGNLIYDPKLAAQIAQRVSEISGYQYWDGNIDNGNSLTLYEVNWYDWEDDMQKMANEFPKIVFTLHCEGMYLDDIWDAGFCGDRMDSQGAYIPDLNYKYLRGLVDHP